MPRYNHYVSSFTVTIELVIDGSPAIYSALQEHPFWHEFVPGLKHDKVTEPSVTWHISEDSTFSYDQTERTIRANAESIKKVIIIIEAALEQLRQARSLYTFHGSVIVRDDKAVALIGNLSGIGKTTLAAYASRHGWIWTVDEKFTVSDGNVIGGTRGLLHDAKTLKAASSSLPTRSDKSYPLVLFCQPIVTTESTLTRFDTSDDKRLWILNDEITRDIRQVNGIVDASLPPLQSFDTTAIAASRIRAVTTLVAVTPLVYLRGSESLLLNEIETTAL